MQSEAPQSRRQRRERAATCASVNATAAELVVGAAAAGGTAYAVGGPTEPTAAQDATARAAVNHLY